MINDLTAYIKTKPKRSLLWLVLLYLFVSHVISSNGYTKKLLLRQYQIVGLANPVPFGGEFKEQLPGGRTPWFIAWLSTGAFVGHVYAIPKEVTPNDLQQYYCNLFLSMDWYELIEPYPNYYSCSEMLPTGKQYYFLGFCEEPNQTSIISIVQGDDGSLRLTVEASYRGSAPEPGC